MLCLLPRVRVPTQALRKLASHRAHHCATGKLTTISPQGTPIIRQIEVWLGDSGSTYVMFHPEISQAFKTGTILQGGCSLAQDPDLLPLNLYHDTRHFSHGMLCSHL